MDRSSLSVVGLALLALGLSVGCSSSGGAGTKHDAGTDSGALGDGTDGKPGDGDGKEDAGDPKKPDANMSGGGGGDSGTDAEVCITSCEDVGAECGKITSCGIELDCDPENDNCTGFDTCGGGGQDNKCGCIAKTCADVVENGAECGQTVPDGCGGYIADCGDCSDKAGANWACGNTALKCECTETTQTEACGNRQCGHVDDGCGGAGYDCGASAGACSVARKCDGTGACVCKSDQEYSTTACSGKTCGTVAVDGCTFTCGSACVNTCGDAQDCTGGCQCGAGKQCNAGTKLCCTPSTQQALCSGKACGTEVTDPCSGTKYTCGCDAGKSCVDKSFIEGASGNQCLADSEANLLGGYVARAHAFINLSTGGQQRAESVSLVKIIKKSNDTYQLTDTGCVATTVSNDGQTTSVAPAYFNIPPVIRPVTVSASNFTRAFVDPGVGLGFIPNLPPYCDGVNATPTAANRADYDVPGDSVSTPTPGSGAIKPWLMNNGGLCTCPTAQATDTVAGYCDPSALAQLDSNDPNYAAKKAKAQNCLPEVNTDSTPTDCRINDVDSDSKAGFTAIANRYVSWTGAVAFANVKWSMTLSASGNHYGTEADPSPLYRQVVACSGLLCAALGAVTNTSCGESHNLVQFHKLAPTDFASMTCGAFYNIDITKDKVDNLNDVKQSAIDSYFQGQNACSATCSSGTVCQQNQCWPETTNGACANSVACGSGFQCNSKVGSSCWPSTCP